MAQAPDQVEGGAGGEAREQWKSQAGFLLASIGGAVGIGNIWRFPYIAYSNGSGSFLVPYLFALFTAGIPLLALEFAVGHRTRAGTILGFRRLGKSGEWVGWWMIVVTFVISCYYIVVIGWAGAYAWFSFGAQWGAETESFFQDTFLGVPPTEAAGTLGSVVPGVLIPTAVAWAVTLFVIVKGVEKGVERANLIMIPLLAATFGILTLRALTLDGAVTGVNELFKPDWSRLADGSIWIAAYGQIFFSTSVGFGTMIVYGSYVPRHRDITNGAFITGLSNAGTELLAGITVFAGLGFLATQQGVGVGDVADDGVGLAFDVFPQIINELPALNSLIGFLFFLSLIFAGLMSQIGLVETYVNGLQDKFQLSRGRAVTYGAGAAVGVSLLFVTNGGLYLLDVVDNFINNFGLVAIAAAEALVVTYLYRELGDLQRHADAVSDVPLGSWFRICVGYISPPIILLVIGYEAYMTIQQGYEGYPAAFLNTFGWGLAFAALAVSVLLSFLPWSDRADLTLPEIAKA